MAETPKLDVRPRTILGKKVGAMRREGRLPAVIFGKHEDSLPIETDARAFQLGYRRWGQTTLLSLTGLDGGEVPVLIHDVSREPRTGSLLHVDFARVSLTEKTHAEVPLHFGSDAPAVKTHGHVLVHALDHLRIEALPQDIPHRIEVDLSKVEEIDDAVYVRDLVVDATTVRVLNDPDELVAKAVAARVEEEVKPVVPAEGEAAEGEAVAEGEAPAAVAGAAPATGAKAAPVAGAAKGALAAGAAKGAPAAKAPEGKGR
ncbi:MAG TPA: 50S ribosomal protein L25 [Candidatus Limnocylindria bacterium]|nr:50S ribosomal protein L25 [Candidatus Limnocylindria bacterium]